MQNKNYKYFYEKLSSCDQIIFLQIINTLIQYTQNIDFAKSETLQLKIQQHQKKWFLLICSNINICQLCILVIIYITQCINKFPSFSYRLYMIYIFMLLISLSSYQIIYSPYQQQMKTQNILLYNKFQKNHISTTNSFINRQINFEQQRINQNNIISLQSGNNKVENGFANLLRQIETENNDNESSINNLSTQISGVSRDHNSVAKLNQKVNKLSKNVNQLKVSIAKQNAINMKRFDALQYAMKEYGIIHQKPAYQPQTISKNIEQKKRIANSQKVASSQKKRSKRESISNIGDNQPKQKQTKSLPKSSPCPSRIKHQIISNGRNEYNNQISQQLFNRNSEQNIMNTQSNNNVRQFQTFQQNNFTSTYEREENAFIQSRIKEQFVEQPNAQFLKRQKLCSDKFVSYLKMQWVYKKFPQKVQFRYTTKLFKLIRHFKLNKVNESVILYALRLINACYPFDKLNVQSKLYAVQIILSHCLIKKYEPYNFYQFFDRLLKQETVYEMIQDFYDKYYEECKFYFGKDLISLSVRKYETKQGFKILQQQKYNKTINQLMIGYYFCKDEQQLCKLHYQEIADTIICYCLMLSHETQQCNRLKGLLLFKSSKAQIEVRFKLLEKGIEKYHIEMNYN